MQSISIKLYLVIFEIVVSVTCSKEWTTAQSEEHPVLVPVKTSVPELRLQIWLL